MKLYQCEDDVSGTRKTTLDIDFYSAVLSLSPMASSVLPVGYHRVFRMFIPGHARLIHTLFEP